MFEDTVGEKTKTKHTGLQGDCHTWEEIWIHLIHHQLHFWGAIQSEFLPKREHELAFRG